MEEWKNEKDFYEFTFNGFKCEAKRMIGMGHLCGYVNLGDFILTDEMLEELEGIAHGGITFNNGDIIGFDCAHYRDLVPKSTNFGDTIYRNIAFVENNLKEICEFLASKKGV